jgi:hypothetical protein
MLSAQGCRPGRRWVFCATRDKSSQTKTLNTTFVSRIHTPAYCYHCAAPLWTLSRPSQPRFPRFAFSLALLLRARSLSSCSHSWATTLQVRGPVVGHRFTCELVTTTTPTHPSIGAVSCTPRPAPGHHFTLRQYGQLSASSSHYCSPHENALKEAAHAVGDRPAPIVTTTGLPRVTTAGRNEPPTYSAWTPAWPPAWPIVITRTGIACSINFLHFVPNCLVHAPARALPSRLGPFCIVTLACRPLPVSAVAFSCGLFLLLLACYCSMPSVSDSAKATTARRIGAPQTRPHTSYRDSALGVFALLLALRIVNALTLRTFFQPDEFFQSLEPAWQLAFGDTSNAWITWVNALP